MGTWLPELLAAHTQASISCANPAFLQSVCTTSGWRRDVSKDRAQNLPANVFFWCVYTLSVKYRKLFMTSLNTLPQEICKLSFEVRMYPREADKSAVSGQCGARLQSQASRILRKPSDIWWGLKQTKVTLTEPLQCDREVMGCVCYCPLVPLAVCLLLGPIPNPGNFTQGEWLTQGYLINIWTPISFYCVKIITLLMVHRISAPGWYGLYIKELHPLKVFVVDFYTDTWLTTVGHNRI